MKKQTQIYLALTLLGVILIGLGCGISIFEISTYQIANYNTDATASDLPPLEKETQLLEASLTGDAQFKLDTNHWLLQSYDIQYDNTLTDKVLIQLDYPKGLYHAYLEHPTSQDGNYYFLSVRSDDFATFRLLLQTAKEGYILNDMPPIKMTLTMSETQAKNFKLNEEQDKAELAEQTQEEQSEVNYLNDQLEEQSEVYQQQIDSMQEQYQTELDTMQQEYDTQLQQKEEQIEQLQQQLDDIRNSLN